ncbi:TetR/AcrR family transcriptional regulator [uncultured Desulfovibrio sp.]|uniref:TetR/AcrR family transcriptional regulator n=1 Tax=uncultured Desulfovibrio sp. TaxID=167968 RepID=UPI00263606E6|nr:TetR/AcrR family transcriptional regulator [uncultured Desulfovibrio sp.]
MSARDIRLAAIRLFGQQGYTATPLSAIAAAVGIKAPSLYAHFRSKEDLFRTVFDEAVRMELQELMAAMTPEASASDGLRRYLEETAGRFESSLHLPFLLRSIYLPPASLAAHIRERDQVFSAELVRRVEEALLRQTASAPLGMSPAEAALAFTGILRGIHAELLYAGPGPAQRLTQALWRAYARALRPDRE